MDAFFEEALAEQGVVAVKSVEFLAQAEGRDDGAGASHLGLAENILQDGDVEIKISNREETPVLRADERLHALQDLGGVILLAFGVIDGSGIEWGGENLTSNVQASRDRDAEVLEERGLHFTDRKQVYEIHPASSKPHCVVSEARVQP
jgi:hypothetical protein